MNFFLPARPEWPRLAMVSFGHRRIGLQLTDQFVVGLGLFPRQINIENEQRNEPHDGHVVGRRTDLPKLSPIHNCSLSRPATTTDHVGTCLRPVPVERSSTVFCRTPSKIRRLLPGLTVETRPCTDRNYFFGSFTSEASITAAGPEIPPSFLTRQKCTIISTEATIGIPMQCQM